MASKCTKCGNTENYNFALNIGLCDICIGEKLEELEGLRDTVSINCNPPADCNDPKVLKTYMKACLDKADK